MNEYLKKAEALRPTLYHETVFPAAMVAPERDANAFQGWTMIPQKGRALEREIFKTGDVFYLDFGRHMTGYLRFRVVLAGTRQDAPVKLRFTFGEMPCEVAEPFETYTGWISSAWLQEELVFLDQLPVERTLPRRYALRYLKVEVLATSVRFGVRFDGIACDAVTSADRRRLDAPALDGDWRRLYDISAATLRDCMQQVFEDGPKRDRRLWMGDLRLQALANYHTYHNDDLVKRCLYLFAGTRDEAGRVMAALYDHDLPAHDENCLVDYAMLYGPTLKDYFMHTGDAQTARELFPVALEQITLVAQTMDAQGLVTFGEGFTCFIDWNQELDKRAAAHGVFLYAAGEVCLLAEALGETGKVRALEPLIADAKAAAMAAFWDASIRRFVSGPRRQVSWASQVWMVLGGVLEGEAAKRLMLDILDNPPLVEMVTPYMVHHMIEALFQVGAESHARAELLRYWRGMAEKGADCFWEIYVPKAPEISPYGHNMIHSYCHAWSCTPAYFLGRYGV